ncbi:MAG TPA: substrate-binding domain-containing protein [Candidatus Hydrogenedentes bacterium]|nr:substrate-binding domain-containing protein [Candidatus Hydrogenedentota bacterium]HPG67369.1 substrate-binding domain-containing protein [Candidatus Hydrogenedentota bacterium]
MKRAPSLIVMGLILIMAASCGKAPSGPQDSGAGSTPPAHDDNRLRIGVMPKLIGIDFFNATEKGARAAAEELGVWVDFDGPVTNDVQLQVQMLETWIAKKYDAIAVAPNDPDAIAPVLERARERGIKVITWDADSKPAARNFFVSQCSAESVARTLMDIMADGVGPEAKYLFLTGSLTAANQNIWMDEMEKYRQKKYPKMQNLSSTPKVSEEDQALATQVTTDCLKTYADLDGIFAITSVALPGAAEGLRKAGAGDRVFLTGLSTPNGMKEYIKDGTLKRFALWNPVDLGYLAVHAAVASAKGELMAGAEAFQAGHLGECRIEKDVIVLGDPIVFDKDNIDTFDF